MYRLTIYIYIQLVRMVTMEGGEDEMRGSADSSQEKIFVSVRVRPLNEKEISNNDASDWECINDSTIIYKNANLSVSERYMYPTAYTFDRVFGTDCATKKVYENGAKDVALSVVSGINSSVFAYGQTSSGKTYTMTGITEYAIADIYEYIEKHTEREFLLKFSAMEIYNESVRDLLNADTTPLRLLDDPERGTVVEKLMEETVMDQNHLLELLSICQAQRQVGETYLNETSSRSHQILRLTIESSACEFLGKDNSSTLTASVDFVDLAGSERASQSLSSGTRLKEGSHINRSLLTLGSVIRKLSKGRSGHIPYRDSKLTRILQPSLGGNARTAIICTMNPARIHVEQSRNTLLFASCAKEVTTSAQVNVVMSDKALVKHLQRELARLESELRSPGSTSIAAEYAALLQQKDLQIEKLEKEIKDLILQRDIAQSQLKEVLQLLGDDGDPLLQQVGSGYYPNLRVRKSPGSEKSSIPETLDSVGIDVRSCSRGHSRNSSEDHFIQVSNFRENFIQNNTPPRLVVSTSNFSESDSVQGWDEMEKQSNGTSEDLWKEVRYIDIEKYGIKGFAEFNNLSREERFGSPVLKVSGSPKLKLVTDTKSIPLKKHQEIVSPSLKEERRSEFMTDEVKELSCIRSVNSSSPAKLSLPQYPTKYLSSSGINMLTKSRSCKERLRTNLSSPWSEKVEKDVESIPNGSERDSSVRPDGLERKSSILNFGPDAELILSGKGSQSSADSSVDLKLQEPNGNSSNNENASINDACHSNLKEKYKLQGEKEVNGGPEKKNKEKANQPAKNVKDVGLDPIEDEFKNISSWPTEFKRLQREIIELWHACHVSLVHRTYFYMLFQGDPTDAIYMEVELRRMSFLKDSFARGEKTVVRGQTLSLASSIKALRQERRMLSKQMLKKLAEDERDMLFLKWGIALNTKLRRLQLAHRLWTSTDNMNHIHDSAYLVAKLVGFIEQGQAPKEMFSLAFAPQFTTRTYSFKRSLLSLL